MTPPRNQQLVTILIPVLVNTELAALIKKCIIINLQKIITIIIIAQISGTYKYIKVPYSQWSQKH